MPPCISQKPFAREAYRKFGSTSIRTPLRRNQTLVARAQDPDEEEFEKRIASLRKAKGAHPYGEKRTEPVAPAPGTATKVEKTKAPVDYSNETVWREFAPSQADLIFNVAMAATLIWIPLTISAVSRCAFVKYKVTDRRIVTITNAPWKNEESMIGYEEVDKVLGVNRGFGLFGDMVVYLKDTTKLELRSVPEWQQVRDYIMERKDAIQGKPFDPMADPVTTKKAKGFEK